MQNVRGFTKLNCTGIQHPTDAKPLPPRESPKGRPPLVEDKRTHQNRLRDSAKRAVVVGKRWLAVLRVAMTTAIDLDELVTRVRSRSSKAQIEEALRCYRAGSFRSTIVQCWIAVVTDIFEKIRELAVSGDAGAVEYISELDKVIIEPDIPRALTIERNILKIARTKFELITENEIKDLERLREDRQRCAHPSLNTPEDLYSPNPELARLHLRNSLEHLLTQPPTQSRATLARIQTEVDSEYFPRTVDGALEYIRQSPLARCKLSLLRGFCHAIISSTLLERLSLQIYERRLLALQAVRQLHREKVETIFRDKLPSTLRLVTDQHILSSFRFLAIIPGTWGLLERDIQLKIEGAVERVDIDKSPGILHYSVLVPALRPIALGRLRTVSDATLAELLKAKTRPEYLDRAVELYCGSRNVREANRRSKNLITPFLGAMSRENIGLLEHSIPHSDVLMRSGSSNDILSILEQAEEFSTALFEELERAPQE